MGVKIWISRPSFDENEERAVLEAIRSRWVSQGPKVAAFEEATAKYVGTRYGRAVTSGTTALHLSLLALGVGVGDKVAVPAYTCVAALHAVEAVGAEPVPCDIEMRTFGADPGLLDDRRFDGVKAIMVAHLFGFPAAITEITALASHKNVPVVEDAAHALGVKADGRPVGTFGAAACLSFHPRKIITTGEGGMVLTDFQVVADRVAGLRQYGATTSSLSRHGQNAFDLPEQQEFGFNFKLTDIQAAVGIEQLKKLPGFIETRKVLARRYNEAFRVVPWLKLPSEPRDSFCTYSYYVVLVTPDERDLGRVGDLRRRLFIHLSERGVSTMPPAQSMPSVPVYMRKYKWDPARYPNAMALDASGVALPIHTEMKPEEQERVVEAVLSFPA